MNREVTLRQTAFMYLFISLSPILRQIPNAVASEAGRSGYLSPLWSLVPIFLLTAILIAVIKTFPGLNIYEIMVQLIGKFFAKLIIFLYLLWILLSIVSKINIYALTIQFTLMPQTRSNYFMIILILLVYFALNRGAKTVFRFSEFTLGPILFLFAVLFLCALTRLRTDYLLPVSTINIPSTIFASKDVIAVGGNIIVILFFADKFGITITKSQIRKLWGGVLVFVILSFVITIFTFGITGADFTASASFPFYMTVKSISFFNIFERFEVLVTLFCVLSDFIAICIMAFLVLRCFEWIFNLKQGKIIAVPLTVLIFYLTYYISSTQFEFNFLYRTIIVNVNLIFQYVIPALLGFLCLIKRKKIQKQF
ncbi:MAG: putative rane protein [Herbinix sp.]|jgi:spore germination protein (amino acid permease)|nr:putative rane protein [Herbinix sp.]